jgi:hypothetical protein
MCAEFTVSLLCGGVFLLADEVFIACAVAGTHIRLFTVHWRRCW